MSERHFGSWRRLALLLLLAIFCGLSNLSLAHGQTPAAVVIESYVRIDQGELRERRMKGYQNAMRFHKMFVEAGRFDMVVKNPEPLDPFYVRGMWGNGTSNVAHLIVNYKY